MAFAKEQGFDPWKPITDADPGTFGVAFFTIIGNYADAIPVCLHSNSYFLEQLN